MGMDRRGGGGGVVAVEKTLTVTQITPELAATLLAGCECLDPSGRTTADKLLTMCQRGTCWAASDETGAASAVWVMQTDEHTGTAWVSACRGTGAVPWAPILLNAIEAQAEGLNRMAFQTARPGLVKTAERHGWQVAGWIMRKDLK